MRGSITLSCLCILVLELYLIPISVYICLKGGLLTLGVEVFESGAIMQYLVDQYDKDHKVSYPFGTAEYYEMNSWVSHTMG
jgi:hypothetical protein